ncbi:MAG: MerR family transcriptional regulator [Clostridiales bacterium]|nr:MerR family transcriptional regulator [Clostridiales bacterium]
MPQYTTGDLAKACDVSVRTVQFYDTKDLLKPSELTEGGRRLYSEDGLEKLRLICMLKSLGLALSSIKGILESENKTQVLLLLLDEQARIIGADIEDRQKQLDLIKIIQDSIRASDALPVNSISGMEHIMNNQKKLRKTHAVMLIVGILMDLIEIAGILLWIFKGIWWPFAAGMPVVILMGLLITRMYHRNTAYVCANCSEQFRPTMRKLLFSKHTPKTRLLQCPKCGHTGYCVEVGAQD